MAAVMTMMRYSRSRDRIELNVWRTLRGDGRLVGIARVNPVPVTSSRLCNSIECAPYVDAVQQVM